jgi:hypothetical protein
MSAHDGRVTTIGVFSGACQSVSLHHLLASGPESEGKFDARDPPCLSFAAQGIGVLVDLKNGRPVGEEFQHRPAVFHGLPRRDSRPGRTDISRDEPKQAHNAVVGFVGG